MEGLPPAIFALGSIVSFVLACALVMWIIRAAGRGKKKTKPKNTGKPSSEEQTASSVPPAPEPESLPVQQEQPIAASEAVPTQPGREELLSIARTDEGDILVLARGQPYRRLRDINDPRLGQDTIEAIHAVLTFAEGWIPFIQKWSSESAAAAQTVAQQPRAPQAPLGVAPHPSRPLGPASTTTIPKPGSLLEPLPLVSEINDLVQRRLKEYPDLSEHLITLTTAIDGGLRIYVDHQAFQSIDAISDPRVRQLIQSAIQEWEGS